jgi:hypothetical protein
MSKASVLYLFYWLCLVCLVISVHQSNQNGEKSEYEGKLLKGNKNAIFVVKKGQRHQFPDFNTFAKMGYDASAIQKISDDILNSIPLGYDITAIPVFRPDDYMYHMQCEDPDRMVDSLDFKTLSCLIYCFISGE